MRRDSNFLLTTILWGNVGINVLLTLLTDSVMTGAMAFVVSTVLITFFGEITPQAYFSRNSLRMASLLAPMLRGYQYLLYPVAKPSAMMLDWWLGREAPVYLRERAVRELLIRHTEADDSDVNETEGRGAANFLAIDDLAALDEGEPLRPDSIIVLPVDIDLPRFTGLTPSTDDPLLQQINASGEKWVILTDPEGEPRLALEADGFLRAALFEGGRFNPYEYCHRPVVIRDERRSLGWVIKKLAAGKSREANGVIENDVVLIWGESPRIITGSDILGRLLMGI
jgi:hypothetical protein